MMKKQEFMSTFRFWYTWLLIASWLIIFFGLYLVAFTRTSLFSPLDSLISRSFEIPNDLTAPPKLLVWLCGVLGATMIGWGIFVWFIVNGPLLRKERWAWFAMTIGMIAWFIPDTLISVICGANFNAVLNVMFLLLFLVPLIFIYKDFKEVPYASQYEPME